MYELVLSYWLLVVESFSTYYHLEYQSSSVHTELELSELVHDIRSYMFPDTPEVLLMIIYVCIYYEYEFVLFTSQETGESPQVLPLRPPPTSLGPILRLVSRTSTSARLDESRRPQGNPFHRRDRITPRAIGGGGSGGGGGGGSTPVPPRFRGPSSAGTLHGSGIRPGHGAADLAEEAGAACWIRRP